MAELDFPCDVVQGFNFEKDRQTLVGHVTALTIGGVKIPVDQALTIPTGTAASADAVATGVKVVGVISHIHWAGGYSDPVSIQCQISTANRTLVSVLTHTKMVDTTVVFQFVVYAFDPIAKVYYEAFNCGATDMNGLILKSGGDLQLAVATDPSNEVTSPLNYSLYISIVPQPAAQVLKAAVSNTDKFVKAWGVAVAA